MNMKYIISGGGTGGHIFPAIAIGKAIERLDPEADILFVGAENRMEMEKVPAAGFRIVGLPVAGFNRKNPFKNIQVILKLYKSLRKAKKVIKDFEPDVAIGVGGYASGPILKEAQKRKIPTLIQEQNSYAGVTNKLLAKNADRICVAYKGMEKFFPPEKILLTGNPLRPEIIEALKTDKKEAKFNLGFDRDRILVVSVGGSLGALSMNEAVRNSLDTIRNSGANLLWQTGKRYFPEYGNFSADEKGCKIKIVPFLEDMGTVYAAADIIVSRAGASTISELQYLGKAAVLIPSPNVAEDHQRKNAEALSDVNAAVTVPDTSSSKELPEVLKELIGNKGKVDEISSNIKYLSKPDADEVIARMAIDLAESKKTR